MPCSQPNLRRPFDRRASGARRAFSLLEMLIVLAILAALTTVAVQSLEPLEQQARFESTQRTLNEIRGGLLTTGAVNGANSISGFVADMGRLPDVSSPQAFYNDLALGTNLPAYQAVNFITPEGGNMQLPCGWRGPYVKSLASGDRFVDGWGRDCGAAVTPSGDGLILSSLGNPTVTSTATPPIVNATLAASSLCVTLYGLDEDNHRTMLPVTGTVTLYAPNPFPNGNGSIPSGPVLPLLPKLSGTAPAIDQVHHFSYDALTALSTTNLPLAAGPRVVGVQFDPGTPPVGVSYTAYQPTTYVTLLPGTTHNLEFLVLRTATVTTTTTP